MVTRYRLVYLGLSLALMAVVGLGIAFGSPGGRSPDRPEQIEGLVPAPGETVLRQARLEIDLKSGYAADIIVDGFTIPHEELFIVEGTGVYSWQPGPGRSLSEWSPGHHEVRIRWDTRSGLPDVGEYTWTFRVY